MLDQDTLICTWYLVGSNKRLGQTWAFERGVLMIVRHPACYKYPSLWRVVPYWRTNANLRGAQVTRLRSVYRLCRETRWLSPELRYPAQEAPKYVLD